MDVTSRLDTGFRRHDDHGGVVLFGVNRRLSAFIGAFNRMGLAEKRGALAMLADILPAGWSLTAPEGGAA